jgi:hypothetical protein
MIWLTWRQFRAQAVTGAAALAVFAVLLAATGPHLASLYAASGVTGCRSGSCGDAAGTFLTRLAATSTYPVVYVLGIVFILAAPAITGIFWGAPLVARELETGTCRLAWNQSITRTRWLAVKLALTGLAAMAVTEALSLMQAWWAEPITRATGLGGSASVFSGGRFSPLLFATHGITPLGYAAFGFALGVTAGVLIRRAVPAMAVTLAVFAAVQLAMPLWARPHLIPPRHTTAAISSLSGTDSLSSRTFTISAGAVPGQPGAWLISSGAVNAAGHPVSAIPATCELSPGPSGHPGPGPGPGPGAGAGLVHCLASHGIREAITYQPASRYWAFQWTETAIYLAIALALARFCFWRLGRRTS